MVQTVFIEIGDSEYGNRNNEYEIDRSSWVQVAVKRAPQMLVSMMCFFVQELKMPE